MIEFAGTYSATLDDKGRIVLPATFKKELGELADEALIIEKNLHKECLDIHPEKFWRKTNYLVIVIRDKDSDELALSR